MDISFSITKKKYKFKKRLLKKNSNVVHNRPKILKIEKLFKRKQSKIPHYRYNTNCINGTLALKARNSVRFSFNKLESFRKYMNKNFKLNKNLKFFFNLKFLNPITNKGIGVRMGRGKGKIQNFLANINRGSLFFEIDGFTKSFFFKNYYLLNYIKNRLPFGSSYIYRNNALNATDSYARFLTYCKNDK